MKLKQLLGFATGVLMVVCCTGLYAQEKQTESEGAKFFEKVSDLGITGKMYLSYTHDFEDRKSDLSLDRAYVTFKRNIAGPISVKFRTDVKKDDNGYQPFVKNAYVQFKHGFGPVKVKAQAGIIGTPNIGITGKMQDLRWIYQDYSFDKASDLIGKTIDTSADVGANLSITFMKKVTITGSLTEGEGYNNAEGDFKRNVIHTTLSINPLGKLYVNGYFKYGDTKNRGYDTCRYFGGGVSWKSKLIKAGVNFVFPTIDDGTAKSNYTIIETWANADLYSATEIPVLVLARFAYGMENNDDNVGKTIFGAGLGYKFNKNFRVLAYFDFQKGRAGGTPNEEKISVKTESKF